MGQGQGELLRWGQKYRTSGPRGVPRSISPQTRGAGSAKEGAKICQHIAVNQPESLGFKTWDLVRNAGVRSQSKIVPNVWHRGFCTLRMEPERCVSDSNLKQRPLMLRFCNLYELSSEVQDSRTGLSLEW